MNTIQKLDRLAIAAGHGYDNLELTFKYSKFQLRVTLIHENDVIMLKSSDCPSIEGAVDEVFSKYERLTGKLPEFDANRTIEYQPSDTLEATDPDMFN